MTKTAVDEMGEAVATPKGSSPYAMFETDPEAEQGGMPFQMGQMVFIIARSGGSNKAFEKAFQKATRPHKQAIERKRLDDATADEIMVKCFARHVLKGWQGVLDADGGELPFTFDNAVKLFTDLPDLFAAIREEAADVSNYLLAAREDDAKS